jgi:alpha-tubulin suppressor-like RCC1 family protein
LVEGIGDAVDLVAGVDHACVLNDAGEVYCWGEASDGRLGDDASAPAVRDPMPVPVRVRMGATAF